MEDSKNRMLPPKREKSEMILAPPVAIPGKVTPCICCECGKGTDVRVLQTFPQKGCAIVRCKSCGESFTFFYPDAENPLPRVRKIQHRT